MEDRCFGHSNSADDGIRASRSAIHVSTAYQCDSPAQADQILAGKQPGFAYQRDGHPNSQTLAQLCARLHQPQASDIPVSCSIAASGMSAAALAMIACLSAGDHVLLSQHMYGKTIQLARAELGRLGITSDCCDFYDLDSVRASIGPSTRMLVAETISNPQLRVIDITSLAELAHENNALLLVDNTFATPIICRPLEYGADLVLESITKFMNGHGDVILGALCCRDSLWQSPAGRAQNLDQIASTWGWSASPFDCWLAERGIATLAVRMKQAADSTARLAEWLAQTLAIAKNTPLRSVVYPGDTTHPDYRHANKQFESGYANMLVFDLDGGEQAVHRFIQESQIAFCPSLGEYTTTLSHPASTSHRLQSSEELAKLGISAGTIRLSVGLESFDWLCTAIERGLAAS